MISATIEVHIKQINLLENNFSMFILGLGSPVHDAALTTIHLSNSNQASQKLYKGPTITVQPKPNWKPRYQSDLIPKPKPSTNGEKKISIGLLQGSGGKRSRVTVEVRLNGLIVFNFSTVTQGSTKRWKSRYVSCVHRSHDG